MRQVTKTPVESFGHLFARPSKMRKTPGGVLRIFQCSAGDEERLTRGE
jgi:hypothetical protein